MPNILLQINLLDLQKRKLKEEQRVASKLREEKNTDEDVMAILKEAINDKSIDPNSDQAKVRGVTLRAPIPRSCFV